MSKKGINLLTQRSQIIAQRRLIEKIKKGSIVILIGYVIFIVIVYAVSIVITRQSASVKSRIVLAEKRIKDNQKAESLEIVLKERMKMVDTLISSGKETYYNKIFEVIRDYNNVPGVKLSSVAFDKTDLSLGFVAQDVNTLSSLVDTLKLNNNKFNSLDIGPFTRTRKGEYNFGFFAVITL